MPKAVFIVRAVVAEPLRQKFDHWYYKASKDDDDDDVDVQNLVNDPIKLRDQIRKQLPPDAQRMMDKMNKP